jgi:hypothetical protein
MPTDWSGNESPIQVNQSVALSVRIALKARVSIDPSSSRLRASVRATGLQQDHRWEGVPDVPLKSRSTTFQLRRPGFPELRRRPDHAMHFGSQPLRVSIRLMREHQ